MSDDKKDALETAASVGVAVAGVAGGLAAVKLAVAAAIPGSVGLAWQRLQERRMNKWWKVVVEGSGDAPQLVAKIEAGLVEEDENVVAGVVGGARAASNAIEPAAVPVVAVLSRRYFERNDLPRWFYRGALEVLERVDAPELGALRRLFVEIQDIRSDSITILGDLKGDGAWRAFPSGVPEPSTALTPFEKPARLFGYLKRAGLGFDSGGFGIGGSPNVLVLDRQTMDWMREALLEGLGIAAANEKRPLL